ncbi:hypothetical protein [Sphingomonas sp. PB4P5]|uniref:hypothetical protein n=1 Tax=Parasphingomonas puruogangriensis TaxID=3096155 RepID=UPI002FCA9611
MATSFFDDSAAVSWFDNHGALHMRVYLSDGNTITERCNDGQGWVAGTSFPGANVSVTSWLTSGDIHLRVYASLEGTVTEWCFDAPASGWVTGTFTAQ